MALTLGAIVPKKALSLSTVTNVSAVDILADTFPALAAPTFRKDISRFTVSP